MFASSGKAVLISTKSDPMSADPRLRVSHEVVILLEPSYVHARHGTRSVPAGHFGGVVGAGESGGGIGRRGLGVGEGGGIGTYEVGDGTIFSGEGVRIFFGEGAGAGKAGSSLMTSACRICWRLRASRLR